MAKSYVPGKSICFIVKKPVKREVFAAEFRDRVIHHFLFNILSPFAEKIFLHDIYSCRKQKGTLFGIKRAYSQMQACSNNFKNECYVLKLDISGYFMNINKDLLYKNVMQLVNNNLSKLPIELNILEYLIYQNIYHDPTVNCKFQSAKKLWEGLPKDKSLFTTPAGCGIPIGNLTSQLYGNLYLNNFDHYVKKELNIKYYGRYVDDFYLFHTDKNILKDAIHSIRNRLKEQHKLKLHPRKIYLQEITKGFSFLGVYILPHRRYIGKRIKKGIYKTLLEIDQSNHKFLTKYLEKLQSYRSHLIHHNCNNLQKTIDLLLPLVLSKGTSKKEQKGY